MGSHGALVQDHIQSDLEWPPDFIASQKKTPKSSKTTNLQNPTKQKVFLYSDGISCFLISTYCLLLCQQALLKGAWLPHLHSLPSGFCICKIHPLQEDFSSSGCRVRALSEPWYRNCEERPTPAQTRAHRSERQLLWLQTLLRKENQLTLKNRKHLAKIIPVFLKLIACFDGIKVISNTAYISHL